MATIKPLDPVVESLLKIRDSAWHFSQTCVNTLDEADRYHPIKPFPAGEAKPHVKFLIDQMQYVRLLALIKHRRMLATWCACVVGTWDAAFHEGRTIAYMSKKEEDADDLVRRCKFILDNIPKDALPIKLKYEYKYTELKFPEIDSRIKAFPQGEDQLRQYTCSRIFADEIAFWPHARASIV